MLKASAERIEDRLPDDALVLDVGGWAVPYPRADWVIDLMPYESRGAYGRLSDDPERFTAATWVQRDLCDRQPWPFADDQFDFAVCAHTLEDVRDPVWVCAELNRVARAGYVEVPSRLEEQSLGVHGPWAGYSHHHWLVDVAEARVEFVFKSHAIHGRDDFHFPAGFADSLSSEERVQQLWWEGGFGYGERIFMETDEHDRYLAGFVAANRDRSPSPRRSLASRLRPGRPS
jgi:hypothetical protein